MIIEHKKENRDMLSPLPLSCLVGLGSGLLYRCLFTRHIASMLTFKNQSATQSRLLRIGLFSTMRLLILGIGLALFLKYTPLNPQFFLGSFLVAFFGSIAITDRWGNS